jgi:hypothetical protein
MEIILALIVLIIVFSIAFLVGIKQGTKQTINKIKKDGGYYDMEYTTSVYPVYPHVRQFKTSSVNDTMGSIGSKPKTQTDYRREHSKEFETAVRDVIITTLKEKHKKK